MGAETEEDSRAIRSAGGEDDTVCSRRDIVAVARGVDGPSRDERELRKDMEETDEKMRKSILYAASYLVPRAISATP